MHLSESRNDLANSNVSCQYYTTIKIMERERKATCRFLYLKYGSCRINKLLGSKQTVNALLRIIRKNSSYYRNTFRWEIRIGDYLGYLDN